MFEYQWFSGEQELQAMIDLLAVARPAGRQTDYPSAADLRELLSLKKVQENARLWLDRQGQLVGFALVDHYNNLCFEIGPQVTASSLGTEMINWGAICMQRANQERGTSLTLDAGCRAADQERIALLKKNGFVQQELCSLRFARPLNEPIGEPELPPDFTMRHVAGEHEVPALVALHRAAFGTENMTVEERLAMMRGPDYEAALDLLVTAPDGRFAATCFCAIDLEENTRSGRSEGFTDPLATHPDFQRQGLARALLLTGLQKLKERGVQTAVLGTSSENVAMQRTAVGVGFRVQSTKFWFAKECVSNWSRL